MRFSTAITFMLPLSALCAPLAVRAPPEVDATISQFRRRLQNAVSHLESLKSLASLVADASIIGGPEKIGSITNGAEAAQISVRQTSDIVEQGFSAENVPHMSQEALRRSVETIFAGRCPMYKFRFNFPPPNFATPGSEDLKALWNGIGRAISAVDNVVDDLGKIASLDGMSLESLFEAVGEQIPLAGKCFRDI